MASAVLGPESHSPLSVIAEKYQTRLDIACPEDEQKFSFGVEYQKKLFSLIDDHLELDPSDRLIYVGDMKGSIARDLEKHFCLIHQVQSVVPGHFHHVETSVGHKTLPVRLSHVGAEDYFRNSAEESVTSKVKYNQILVNNCVRYLEQPRTAYKNMIASLASGGRLLIIHRTGSLNTLPYFSDAVQRLTDTDMNYADIVKDLHLCNLDVTSKIECLPVSMSKKKWLSLLKDRFPTQTEIFTDIEVVSGIRELSEGILKYEGDIVDFVDRLVFISATAHQNSGGHTTEGKKMANVALLPRTAALKYVVKICPEQLKELMGRLKS
ncbi:unnamed protein product [Candidula unifasciata]|uniref:Uncharacterized protein n=1 Tax=Candidula unifasciata TaxID=100452 RepID=A0A8S3YTS2_9EUPU|nr:unnamed protein product [Candidula unifasciata]